MIDHPKLPLPVGHIHFWLVFEKEIESVELLGKYRALMTDDERRQEKRFHFAKDRRRYLITRALVRDVLSRYCAIHPGDWRFRKGPHGRPEIVNENAFTFPLSFNISHADGLIVCGVTRDGALGVDVENFRSKQVSLQIADRFFSAEETAALYALPPQMQYERFFEYWTLKESYIKARGKGLAIPLRQFSFRFPEEDAVQVAFEAELKDDPASWQFWLFRPSPDHIAAICAEQGGVTSKTVKLKQVVPLQREESFECEMQRSSTT